MKIVGGIRSLDAATFNTTRNVLKKIRKELGNIKSIRTTMWRYSMTIDGV